MYEILDKINSPSDLKSLNESEILVLNREIRDFLIENVTKTGGHLASNLGIVELTVAMHKVFDTPKDRIIFDVGHQSYVHKILTGRKDAFSTLRHENGLSGFTKRSESEYDCFGAGHSSTSVSAALGFAEADRICGRDNYTIAVVGDGAFTGGLIYEALNNCSDDTRLIIVLNENEMSISKNVGNLSKHISKVRATKGYLEFKKGLNKFFGVMPVIGKPLYKFFSFVKFKLKSAVYSLNMFENMGLKYLGPINGNDYYSVQTMLEEAKRRNGNVLIHIKTVKGQGFDKAVENPKKYHGISPCDQKKSHNGSFSSHAGEFLCECASENSKICAITAAMSNGTGIECFEKSFPERCFDVGIAEGHATTFFAGLSAAGMKPVFAVYSTFLQRAYDNILHDVALQKLGGIFLIDRAGFATEDGATHHGIYDTVFLPHASNTTIYEPVSYSAMGAMIRHAASTDGLFAIRYPKGGEDDDIITAFNAAKKTDSFDILTYGLCDNGKMPRNIIITYGRIAKEALAAAETLKSKGNPVGIVLLQTLKPLEKQAQLISELISCETQSVAFLEEGIYEGGVAMLLREALADKGVLQNIKTQIFAVRGDIPEQATLERIYENCSISRHDLVKFFGGNF